MNSALPISAAKKFLQKGSSFLFSGRRQRRTLLLHEIRQLEKETFRKLLALVEQFPKDSITLTFDDGFSSSYRALRELQQHKAIFFVCPEFINRAGTLQWKEFFYQNLLRTESLDDPEFCRAVEPATWENLQELVRQGHTIGSHTMNHRRLSRIISHEELEREIIGSADLIEEKLNVKVEHFAYPFGTLDSIDERAYQLIKKRYRYCYTGIRGNNRDNRNPYAIWRDTAHLIWPLDYISFFLKGGLDWRYIFRRRKITRMINQIG